MANSPLPSRSRLANLAGMSFDGQRDLYSTMGYPRHLTVEDFFDIYLRQDIAGRIVDAYPDATWREPPTIAIEKSPLQDSFDKLEKKHSIWRTLHRLDRLSGIGHYGVLLLGLDGGEPLHEPVIPGKSYELIYARPHSERTAQITRWDDNPNSPRFGKPMLYSITSGVNWTGAGAGFQRIIQVHHSRVMHIAERPLEDESIGTPRLERIWNRLMDLDKLLGGSAEMYWQNVAMLIQLDAATDVEWDPEEAEVLAGQVEEMQHNLRRWLRTRGVTANNIAPGLQGNDPSTMIEKLIDVVAGATGIPKRILLGTEAGELGSSQDENNWSGRIQERREQFAGPSVIEPFIQKMQSLGVMPRDEMKVEWPESDNLGEEARATIAATKATALAHYANTPGAELIISPAEFRYWLGEEGPMPEFEEDEELASDLLGDIDIELPNGEEEAA